MKRLISVLVFVFLNIPIIVNGIENKVPFSISDNFIYVYYSAEKPPNENIPEEAPLCYKFKVNSIEEQLRKLKNKYKDLYDYKIEETSYGDKILTAKRDDTDGREVSYFYSTNPEDCTNHSQSKYNIAQNFDVLTNKSSEPYPNKLKEQMPAIDTSSAGIENHPKKSDWRAEFMSPEEIRKLDKSLQESSVVREGHLAAQDDPRFKDFISKCGISSDEVPDSGWSTLLYIYKNRGLETKEYKDRLTDLGKEYFTTERLRKYHAKLYNELEANWKSGTLEQAEYLLTRIAGTIGAPGKDWHVESRDSRSCFKKGTPAERIAELQAGAENVITKDLSNGGVEVGYYDEAGTFYTRPI
jgi:hypothetical protein